MGWSKLTIGQFQDCYKILNSEKDILDKKVSVLSIYTGKSVEWLRALPISKLFTMFELVKFMDEHPKLRVPKKYFYCKRWWKVTSDLSKFNTDMFATITKLSANEKEVIHNLHLICGVVCEPVFGKMELKDKADILKGMSYQDANDISAFFLLTLIQLPHSTQTYLDKVLRREATIAKRLIARLNRDGGGWF